jgi:riboflavin synthase
MFTGIVEGMAKVESVSRSKKGADIAMRVKLGSKLAKGLRVGDSVCVSGACLTVARTNLSAVKPGDMVNIERSLKVGDRLEGHFVLGHVDGTGVIKDIIKLPSETKLWIRLDDALLKSVVPKGSIAVDGVSLTLVDVKNDRVSVSLIPHTLSVTTLGHRSKGDRVNIETDILGKYILSDLPPN